MYDRSSELDCTSQFTKLGRIRNKSSELIHKELSSSALGDNTLKYIDMNGRIIIDMMKIIRRDHSLDHYKLDFVATHFLRGRIETIEIQENDTVAIKVDHLNGLNVGDYINLIGDDISTKVQMIAIDVNTKIVYVSKNDIYDKNQFKQWGLAKDDVSPNDIFECQKGTSADRAKIAKYCVQDCALCNILMIKLEVIANNIGMSNVCCVPLSYIFMRGQGIKIFSLVSKQCREDDYVIPTLKKSNDEDEIEDEGYEGAIVLDPVPGIYVDEPISVMDYASLYPSSMISENISHDSIVLDSKYDNLPNVEYVDINYDIYEGKGDAKKKVGVKTCRYAQFKNNEKGVLPRILMQLLKARKSTRKRIGEKKVVLKNGDTIIGFEVKSDDSDIYKLQQTSSTDVTLIENKDIEKVIDAHDEFMKAVLDGLQLAYKVTANSLYGQVGARTSNIYLKELAASTTATGRDLILKAKHFMEKNYKADIIYGDTDSIFVDFHIKRDHPNLTDKEVLQQSIDLATIASKEFKKATLKAPHDLEYEKTFYPFIIFSKKRYVGNLYEFDVNKFKQKCMGIALKRRDNSNIVKIIYGGIIDIILNEKNVMKAIEFLNNSLQDLIKGNVDISDLVITKNLKGDYVDPTKIAHKVLVDRMRERDPGSAPQVNDRIPFVYIDVGDKTNTVLQGDRIEHPTYIKEHNLKIDYQFYITNQLSKPITQIFALALNEIPKFHKKQLFQQKEQSLLKEYKSTPKKAHDKIMAMKMNEAYELLFKPIIQHLENKRNKNSVITDFFKANY